MLLLSSSVMKQYLDGDVLISLSHNDPHRRRDVVRILKAVIYRPQGILHLQCHMLLPLRTLDPSLRILNPRLMDPVPISQLKGGRHEA